MDPYEGLGTVVDEAPGTEMIPAQAEPDAYAGLGTVVEEPRAEAPAGAGADPYANLGTPVDEVELAPTFAREVAGDDLVRSWQSMGRIGARETAGKIVTDPGEIVKRLPFSPAGALESGRLLTAVNRLKEGDGAYSQAEATDLQRRQEEVARWRKNPSLLASMGLVRRPEEARAMTDAQLLDLAKQESGNVSAASLKEEDERLVGGFLLDRAERAVRGTTIGADITAGASELPAFMAEFIATGGGATAAKQAVAKLAEKLALKGVAAKAAGFAAATGARAALTPQRIAEGAMERQLPAEMSLTDKGLTVTRDGDKPVTALFKAIGDQVIEMGTEMAGGPAGQAVRNALAQRLKKDLTKAAGSQAKRLFTKLGYDGFIEEMGEEKLGELLRGATGVENFAGDPNASYGERLVGTLATMGDGRNLLTQAGILAIPGAARAAGVLAEPRKVTIDRAEKQLAQDFGAAAARRVNDSTLVWTMPDGKQVAVQTVAEEKDLAGALNGKAYLDSVKGTDPQAYEAAMTLAQGDAAAAEAALKQTFARRGQTATGVTLRDEATGEKVAADVLIQVVDGQATMGHLKHETLHAMATLAGNRVEGGKLVDPASGEAIDEERLAAALAYGFDHPVARRIRELGTMVRNWFPGQKQEQPTETARRVWNATRNEWGNAEQARIQEQAQANAERGARKAELQAGTAAADQARQATAAATLENAERGTRNAESARPVAERAKENVAALRGFSKGLDEVARQTMETGRIPKRNEAGAIVGWTTGVKYGGEYEGYSQARATTLKGALANLEAGKALSEAQAAELEETLARVLRDVPEGWTPEADISDVTSQKEKAVPEAPAQGETPADGDGGGVPESTTPEEEEVPDVTANDDGSAAEAEEDVPDWVKYAVAIKENPEEFKRRRPTERILAPDGKDEWARINDQVAREAGIKAGPIKLLVGQHTGKNQGFGLTHILEEHRDLFGDSAEKALAFIQDTMRTFNHIWQQPNGRLVLKRTGPQRQMAVIELRNEGGGFYSIVTAYRPRPNQKMDGRLIWRRRESLLPDSRDASPAEPLRGQKTQTPPLESLQDQTGLPSAESMPPNGPEVKGPKYAVAGEKEAEQEPFGMPRLSQIASDKQARDLVSAVDEVRKLNGLPEQQKLSDWQAAADKRVAADPDGEWQKLVAGEANLEDGVAVLTARKLINDKALAAMKSGNSAALIEAAAAVDQYRNIRSDQARALAAGRDFQEKPADRMRRLITEAIYYPGEKLVKELAKATKEGKLKLLQEEAKRILDVRQGVLQATGLDVGQLSDKALNDPATAGEVVRQVQVANAKKDGRFTYGANWAHEFWRNSILSGMPTHVANIVGNAANVSWEYGLQKPTEAALNLFFRDPKGTTLGELAPMYRAFFANMSRAGRNAMLAFSTEQPITQGQKMDEKGVVIGGGAGRAIRVPQRALLAADEFFKTLAVQSHLAARAHRQAAAEKLTGKALEKRVDDILAAPPAAMLDDAMEEAKRMTFQDSPGAMAKEVLKLREKVPGLRWLVPFVSTPANILKTGIRKSPLGSAALAVRAARGEYAGDKALLARHAAEQVLAWAAFMAVAGMAGDDDDPEGPRITGSKAPRSVPGGERASGERYAPSQSVRIGGRWYSYARIEPLATSLTTMVDLVNAMKDTTTDPAGVWARFAESTKAMVRDKTFLQGLGDLMRAMDDSAGARGKAEQLLQNFAASWVPNLLRSPARATDDQVRDYRIRKQDNYTAVEYLGDMAARIGQKALPIAGTAPIARRDWQGRVIEKTERLGPAGDLLWRVVMGTRVQAVANPDNLDRFLVNYNRRAQENGWEQWWPGQMTNRMTIPGRPGQERTRYMTDDEFERFQIRKGELLQQYAGRRRWNWDKPSPQEMDQLRKLNSQANDVARREIMRTHPKAP